MPLFSFWKISGLIFSISLLSGCNLTPPEVQSTGYTVDEGVIRVWRQDNVKHQPVTLVAVYTPFTGQPQLLRYEYREGNLRQIESSSLAHPEENPQILLRFDENNDVSFMQRKYPSRKESLSSDEIALYRYAARTILEHSTALIAGDVKLMQGTWVKGQIFSCEGKRLNIRLDVSWLERQQKYQTGAGLAWLESSEGTQLLLVSHEDLCSFKAETLL